MMPVYLPFLLLFLAVAVFYSWTSIAPWAPTRTEDLETIHQRANLQDGETFVELGCGDARVSHYIAQKNPLAQVIGIELSIFSFLHAHLKHLGNKPANLTIQFGDALKYNLNQADVIYVFAMVKPLNRIIKHKLNTEMKPTGKCISYIFAIEEWNGKTESYPTTKKTENIYVYKK